MSYSIFISHFATERGIAQALRDLLDEAFVGHVDPFISSDISAGQNWLSRIKETLAGADEVLTVFTFNSVERPWINIETGYGIMCGRVVTPVLFYGFSFSDLPLVYQMQQSADDREDGQILRLYDSILSRVQAIAPRANAKWTREEFLSAWRSRVTGAAARSPSVSSRPSDMPLIWLIGSHDGLSIADQHQALQVCRTVARLCFENRFRIVCGTSRMLEFLVDSHEAVVEPDLPAPETPGDLWRKTLSSAHADEKRPVPNPIVILGTLRTPNIRTVFDDALGRIPDLAIIIGGRSGVTKGRTHDEYYRAVAAGIPVLPIAFTGGAAAELAPNIKQDLLNIAEKLGATRGKLDDFGALLLEIIRRQLEP